MKTNLMHYLSSVYFVNHPLHSSDIFVAHHQEVGMEVHPNPANRQSTEKPNTYQLLGYTVYLLMMDYKYVRNMQRLIDEINRG